MTGVLSALRHESEVVGACGCTTRRADLYHSVYLEWAKVGETSSKEAFLLRFSDVKQQTRSWCGDVGTGEAGWGLKNTYANTKTQT